MKNLFFNPQFHLKGEDFPDESLAWDEAQNTTRRKARAIVFEDIAFHLERGDILDILEHPNADLSFAKIREAALRIEIGRPFAPCLVLGHLVAISIILRASRLTVASAG